MQKVKEKKERALGVHLHLKGIRCASPKCALTRRPYPPGMHGKKKKFKSVSEYGQQLNEKQKLKLYYNISERTLRHLFKKAQKSKGSIAVKFLELLEKRLSNVIFLAGFCLSRAMARNMLRDRHVLVNNKKVNIGGYEVKIGDVISLDEKIKKTPLFEKIVENLKNYNPPKWLKVDKNNFICKVIDNPEINFESLPFKIEPIIDLFSR